MPAPLVTFNDRQWALNQCPAWASRSPIDEDRPELVDTGAWLEVESAAPGKHVPNWDSFVIEQIERFEKFFAGQEKSYSDWSNIWRKSWWPKANPSRRFPKSAPQKKYPFFRAGSPEFARAMALGTAQERLMWERFNVAQFEPDDLRLKQIVRPQGLSEKSKSMAGER